MPSFKIQTRQINKEGKLAWEYNPLYNLVRSTTNDDGEAAPASLSSFDTKDINFDINHPVDIECQPSYDGSVNLIINDDNSVPRIINSGFTLLEDNSYERVARNQIKPTNVYKNTKLETMLQRCTKEEAPAVKVELEELYKGGELEGGNYTFLFKYTDDDENATRIIAESSIVSVFKNDGNSNASVLGTLENEKTDLAVKLRISNVDRSFSKIQVLYRRNYSDLTGTIKKEYYRIVEPFRIPDTSEDMIITITGIEPKIGITYDDIIKQFNTYRTVKTQTQVQNMLFFGNVTEYRDEESILQNLAYRIQVSPVLGGSLSLDKFETYKSSANIYNNLGYMPGEYYRIGIVFVYNDESLSQAYNLRGCCFDHFEESNIDSSIDNNTISHNEVFIDNSPKCYNTRGIFRMPDIETQLSSTNTNIYPIKLSATIPTDVLQILKDDLEIRGYFFVRQARIPLFLGQGLSIGISEGAHCPLLRSVVVDGDKETVQYGVCTPLDRSEGTNSYFLKNNRIKWFDPNQVETVKSPYDDKKNKWEKEIKRSVKTKGLLCADSYLVPQMQSVLDGSEFILKAVAKYSIAGIESVGTDGYYTTIFSPIDENTQSNTNLVRSLIHIPAETPSRIYNEHVFSSKCGSSQDIKSAKTLLIENENSTIPKPFTVMNDDLIRGNFGSYIGVCGDEISADVVYNIYSSEYPGEVLSKIYNHIEKLAYNNTEFYAVSDKTYFYTYETPLNTVIAGGDCFYCNVSTKLQYNFLDNNAPLNSNIVSTSVSTTYGSNNEKYLSGEKFSNISADGWLELNSSDFNAVHFGTIISYQCMSNYNLNVRALDDQRIDERALYGDCRSFWPRVQAKVPNSAFKLPESTLLPMGNSSTLRCFPYYVAEQVPFTKKHFDNRIAFSNVQSNDSFANSYRIFTGLSYQDIERTYGAITKLVPLGANLFCVFEHGCGIVPINEKALLSTMQGQSIHLYGSQVIQSQVTIVSQDYGSTWEDSIVVTPNGIYGVDTWAKKIWRYTNNGFSLISDQIVQRYLNDNITLEESDLYPITSVKNIKTHFNNYKGDVMFTFYNDDMCWNLCYNERIDKFVTRYSWTPLLSENIQNSYISVDRTAVETYAIMAKNMEPKQGKFYLEDPKLNYSDYNTHKLTGVTKINSDGSWTSEDKEDVGFYSGYELNIDGYADVYDMTTAIIKGITYATWDDKTDKVVISKVTNTEENCFKHDFTELDAVIDNKSGSKKVKLPSKGNMFCLKWGKDLVVDSPFIIPEDDVIDDPGHEENLYGTLPDNSELADTDELEEEITITYDGNKVNDHGFSLNTNYNNFKRSARNYVSVEKGKGVKLDVKLNDFVCWLKIDLEATPHLSNEIAVGKYKYNNYTALQPFTQSIVLIPNYSHLTKVELQSSESDIDYAKAKEAYDKVNRVGLYVHGRSGIYDEINYTDSDPDNQIKPTFWYNKQEPFEFEFVVNTGAGMQKIFNNLAIISNNAEPEALEFSIIGDAYDFNKAGIFGKTLVEPIEDDFGILDSEKTLQAKLKVEYQTAKEIPGIKDAKYSTRIDNGSISRDPVLQQYYLHVEQPCRNIKEHGKLRGNIEYREDKWLLNIVPIKFQNVKLTNTNGEYDDSKKSEIKSAKLRDKWCKVRIKYKGDKLAVISAIQTMFTVSFT